MKSARKGKTDIIYPTKNVLIINIDGNVNLEQIIRKQYGDANLFAYDEDIDTINEVIGNLSSMETLPDIDKEKIQIEVRQYLPEFYCKNQQYFEELKSEFGINIWFYLHFQLYFHIRNILYFRSKVHQFLAHEKDRYVLTSSKILPLFGSRFEGRITQIKSVKRNENRFIPNLLGIFQYGKFLFANLKMKQVAGNTLLINNAYANILQEDQISHRVFFEMVNDYPNLIQTLIPSVKDLRNIQPSLEISRKLAKNSKSNTTSESIFLRGVTFSNVRKLLKFKAQYRHLLKQLKPHNEFDINALLINFLKSNTWVVTMNYFQFLSYRKFFRNHPGIQKMIITDENSPQTRPIWEAGRQMGVLSFAVQHGAIHEFHPAYNYKGYPDVAHILCDYALVWGQEHLNLLKRFQYPAESVNIVGQIRTDQLLQFNYQKVNAWKTKNKIGESKIICYASQPQRDSRYREKVLLDVANACLTSDHYLLIRPHPREKEEDFAILRSISGLSYQVDKASDLYFHFALSDALITCFSTVGGEFAIFNKPLIIVDYLKQDVQQYVKSGIGIPAHSYEQLEALMKTISNITIDQKKYDVFIQNYFNSIDGQVKNRVHAFVNNTSHSNRLEHTKGNNSLIDRK